MFEIAHSTPSLHTEIHLTAHRNSIDNPSPEFNLITMYFIAFVPLSIQTSVTKSVHPTPFRCDLRRANTPHLISTSFLPLRPTFPKSTCQRTKHSSLQPRSTPQAHISNENNPLTTITNRCSTLIYTLLPSILSAQFVFPTIAQENSDPLQAGPVEQAYSALEAVSEGAEDTPLFRFLVITVLVLAVYLTVATIILTINSIIVRQNDKRSRRLILERLGGKGRATTKGNPTPGLNRQSRRLEKKLKEQERRQEKKKEKSTSKPSTDDKPAKS